VKRLICWLIGHKLIPECYMPHCERCDQQHWEELGNSFHVEMWRAVAAVFRHRKERAEQRREQASRGEQPEDIPF
jgi:hypothetical protein